MLRAEVGNRRVAVDRGFFSGERRGMRGEAYRAAATFLAVKDADAKAQGQAQKTQRRMDAAR